MQGGIMDAADRGEKRRTGVYYTPPHLAQLLCRECLAHFISTRLALSMEDAEKFIECDDASDIPASVRPRSAELDVLLRDITVIDPAAGKGAMLLSMLAELVRARSKAFQSGGREPPVADLHRTAATHSLHGVDLDVDAIEMARKALIEACGSTGAVMMEREKAGIASHVMSGNSLADIGKLVQYGAFDIVISNPPYLSYYGNAPARMNETEKNSLLQNYELVDRSNQRINAMNLFIELGIKLLKDGGILAYVLNKTLCVLPSYRKTRAYILSNSTINRVIVDLDPFDAIVDCATLCLSKTKPHLDYTLNWCSLKGLPADSTSLAPTISNHQVQIPITQFSKHKQLEFTYSVHDPILEKMERAEHKLRDILVINRGINIGGCSEHFLSNTARDERYGIILDAKHVRHYSAWWDDYQGFFVFDQEKERMLRVEGKTLVLGDPSRYEGPRLFIPEASKGIRAAYVDAHLYSAYGILVGKSKHSENELKIACALLNSRAISFYAIEREILRKGKKATPHAGVKGLAELPVPSFSATARETLIELVDEILEQLGAGLVRARNGIPSEIKSLMAGIDSVVYDAFHLGTSDILSINDAVDSLFK
jgi:hypothetical protein